MTSSAHTQMQRNTVFFRYTALVSHGLLLALIALWRFYFDQDEPYSTLFIVLFYLLPLALPLPGIIKAKPYTHAWASFIILFYFTHGITVMYAVPEERLLAFFELALATTMFIACCMFARLRGKELGLKLGKLKDVMAEEKAYFEGE